MRNNYCHNDSCFAVIPSGEDVNIHSTDCDVQVDITAQRMKSVVVWGHVMDCKNRPIERALVKLLQYMNTCTGQLRGICHTYTDCNGFYQLDLPSCGEGKYRVLVSKSACSNETSRDSCPTAQEHCEQENWHDMCSERSAQKRPNHICYY